MTIKSINRSIWGRLKTEYQTPVPVRLLKLTPTRFHHVHCLWLILYQGGTNGQWFLLTGERVGSELAPWSRRDSVYHNPTLQSGYSAEGSSWLQSQLKKWHKYLHVNEKKNMSTINTSTYSIQSSKDYNVQCTGLIISIQVGTILVKFTCKMTTLTWKWIFYTGWCYLVITI